MNSDKSYGAYLRQEQRRRALADQLLTKTKHQLFEALKAADVTSVLVSFDGEGDSGQINDIFAVTADKAPAPLSAVQLTIAIAKPDGSGAEHADRILHEVIETLCYDFLADHYGGWENNDGACGEFAFDVAARTVTLTMNQRVSDYDTTTQTF